MYDTNIELNGVGGLFGHQEGHIAPNDLPGGALNGTRRSFSRSFRAIP
jgi:hypothetical protein